MIKRFFYDFEFEEKPTQNGVAIDIISLGMIDENKKGIYLVNKNYDWNKCTNEWLKQNVQSYLQIDKITKNINLSQFKNYILQLIDYHNGDQIQLYGYYSAYDHVCLGNCFGRMIDLPKYIPMLTYDLKQIMDNQGITEQIVDMFIKDNNKPHNALSDCLWNLKLYKFLKL